MPLSSFGCSNVTGTVVDVDGIDDVVGNGRVGRVSDASAVVELSSSEEAASLSAPRCSSAAPALQAASPTTKIAITCLVRRNFTTTTSNVTPRFGPSA